MSEDVQYTSLELARVRMFLDITMDRLHDTEDSLTSIMRSFSLLRQKYDIDIKHHASSFMSELKERAVEMNASIRQGYDEILSQIVDHHTTILNEIQERCLEIHQADSTQRMMLSDVEDLQRRVIEESQKDAQVKDMVQSIRKEYSNSLKDVIEELQASYHSDRDKAIAELENILKRVANSMY
jgi:putative protein kinase ArgK-like GTPase of G3E family